MKSNYTYLLFLSSNSNSVSYWAIKTPVPYAPDSSEELPYLSQLAFSTGTVPENGIGQFACTLGGGEHGLFRCIAALLTLNPAGIGLILQGTNQIGSFGSAAYASQASYLGAQASYERRSQEWAYQENIANQDIEIGQQQITIAQDGVSVAAQEQTIAQMQTNNDAAILNFLATKFTNADLYDWMSQVLSHVYRFFLQQATAMAQQASNQLAFERAQTLPAFIQSDYWQPPASNATTGGSSLDGTTTDRNGLTGSARLLQDIYQLDQYAFTTDQRKLQLTKTLSLATLAPAEFQSFRETGVMASATPMSLFDADFPRQAFHASW